MSNTNLEKAAAKFSLLQLSLLLTVITLFQETDFLQEERRTEEWGGYQVMGFTDYILASLIM